MGTTPQELMEDIRRTRADLADDVDQLADRLSPKQAARRGVARVGDRVQAARDTVVGTVMGTVMGTAERVEGMGSDMSATVSSRVEELPARARSQAQGSPAAAGVIAFGAGLLVAALLPSSAQEQRLAEGARDRAQELKEPLVGELGDLARTVAADVRPAVEDAVESVKESAQQAGRELGHDRPEPA